ncbi:MAG: hypothetical protein ABSB78_07140 [Bacteroidota bacterium]
MTTRHHSAVVGFPDHALEKIAYASVETIPVREPNDRARLGYHVWQFLSGKIPNLEEAIRIARSRLLITKTEVNAIILQKLKERGIQKIL